MLSGNGLRQTVHTHYASVHQAAKLVAALLRVARVTAGLAESNGSLPPGLWLTSPAGWLPRTRISSGTLRSVIEYGIGPYIYLYFFIISYNKKLRTSRVGVDRRARCWKFLGRTLWRRFLSSPLSSATSPTSGESTPSRRSFPSFRKIFWNSTLNWYDYLSVLASLFMFLLKHQRQGAQATYMPVK